MVERLELYDNRSGTGGTGTLTAGERGDRTGHDIDTLLELLIRSGKLSRAGVVGRRVPIASP
jgi:hypothetical protein